ncbi:hypothetical protein D3C78_1842180 [compost metagenome]
MRFLPEPLRGMLLTGQRFRQMLPVRLQQQVSILLRLLPLMESVPEAVLLP